MLFKCKKLRIYRSDLINLFIAFLLITLNQIHLMNALSTKLAALTTTESTINHQLNLTTNDELNSKTISPKNFENPNCETRNRETLAIMVISISIGYMFGILTSYFCWIKKENNLIPKSLSTFKHSKNTESVKGRKQSNLNLIKSSESSTSSAVVKTTNTKKLVGPFK